MTASERQPVARGAVAGFMLLAALIICGALGAAAGALVGALAPLLLVGIAIGFVVGIAAVRARFPDL